MKKLIAFLFLFCLLSSVANASREIVVLGQPGKTVFCLLYVGEGSNLGKFLNTNALSLDDLSGGIGTLSNYTITMTEQGGSGTTGIYFGNIPTGAPGACYVPVAYTQAGGAPATSDMSASGPWVTGKNVYWSGTALIAYQSGDAYSRLGSPVGASVSADIANVYTRLGAPTGASISADIASLPSAGANATAVWGAGARTLTALPATAPTWWGTAPSWYTAPYTDYAKASVAPSWWVSAPTTSQIASAILKTPASLLATDTNGYTTFNNGSIGSVTGSVASVSGTVNANVTSIAGKSASAAAPVAFPASISSYGGADTAGTTTLLSRIPGTVQPQSGDAYARIGAPVGASISADIAGANNTLNQIYPATSALVTWFGTVSDANSTTTTINVTGLTSGDLTGDFLIFTSPNSLRGISRQIIAHNTATNVLTVSPALPSVPGQGYAFAILPGNKNFINLMSLVGNPSNGSISADIAAVASKTALIGSNSADSPNQQSSQSTITTINTRLGAPTGASISADIASLPSAGANATAVWGAGARTLTALPATAPTWWGTAPNWFGDTSGVATLLTRIPGTIQPQSGDSYARLGPPIGASVSADVATANTGIASLPSASAIATALFNTSVDGTLTLKQITAINNAAALESDRTWNATTHTAVVTFYRRQNGSTAPDKTRPIKVLTTVYDSTNTQVVTQSITLSNLP